MGRRRRIILKGLLIILVLLGAAAGIFYYYITPARHDVPVARALPSPEELTQHCEDHIGPPRVETITEGVHVAIGYDLANTILIETDEGNVVIDVSSSPARAREVRAAFGEIAEARTRALILTHSHIDHIGGGTVWVDAETQVWGTDAFIPHFFKQYGLFREAEMARGSRQFGMHVPDDAVPCSALGPRPDIVAALELGVVLPTHTFSGSTSLEIGGVQFELQEAHGETHDQLFVWLPQRSILLPGDNYYRAFPNLYTIRGTRPRPVAQWIESLDTMRRLDPLLLVPSHTIPVIGREAVREELRIYRDGIQWVRDAVVRGANRGLPVDELAATIGLPDHLAQAPALRELYGQLDWSVRAIYGNELGWFDGSPHTLYPLPPTDEATRMVDLIGGTEAVWAAVRSAQTDGEHQWALHLLNLLRQSGLGAEHQIDETEAISLRGLAEGQYNTNGRAYLLESALERTHTIPPSPQPTLNDGFIDRIPLALLFEVMAMRLEPELGITTHESVHFRFPDVNTEFVMTVRHGIAEVVEGDPLPGTPEPLATVIVDSGTWRRISLDVISPADALTSGAITIEGSGPDFLRFVRRFRRGI